MGQLPNVFTPKSVDELVAILEQEVRVRKYNLRTARLGSIALVLGLFAFWGILAFTKGTSFLAFLSDYGAFFLVAAGGVALSARHRNTLLQTQSEDPRLAGFLIEALTYKDRAVVRHAETLLADQLPHLDALHPAHAGQLAAHIGRSQNKPFVRSALRTLRRFGTAACLPELDALAKQRDLSIPALEAAADIRLRTARQTIERETTVRNRTT